MGHAGPAELADLKPELDLIRGLPGVKEPRPNIFYLRSKPFLHFHTKDLRRWADCRLGADWGPELELPFDAERAVRKEFVAEVRRRYERTTAS